jgi:cell division protein FtsW (lipid II flippase)
MASSDTDERAIRTQTLLLLTALAAMGGLIYYIYTYPHEATPSLLEFTLLWLRELLFLAAAALIIVFVLTSWCIRFLKRIKFWISR